MFNKNIIRKRVMQTINKKIEDAENEVRLKMITLDDIH